MTLTFAEVLRSAFEEGKADGALAKADIGYVGNDVDEDIVRAYLRGWTLGKAEAEAGRERA